MKVDIEDLESGVIDVVIGLKQSEIFFFIDALKKLKENKDHFHFRTVGRIKKGISDIEFYWLEEGLKDNMKIDASPIIEPN